MRVLHIAGLAIIFASVRSTTSTASGQGWATKPYENPSGYGRPATRPNDHAIYKREIPTSTRSGQRSQPLPPHLIKQLFGKHIKELNLLAASPTANIHHLSLFPSASSISGQHSLSVSTETMTDNHPEHHHQPRPVMTQMPGEANIHKPHTGMTSAMSGQHSLPESTEIMTDDHPEHHRPRPVMTQNLGANIHKPLHTGMTSTMSGQHSQPESTGTMIDDHPEHHHRPLPVITQKPGPIPEIPLMSSEGDSEEHTMPLVMTEDNAMMPSEELPNAHESNKAIIDEMSEHDEVISIHEFKEVLHELIEDAVDKIVMKKAGIVGKLKTAKQNLIGQDGEATGRDPQQSSRASNFLGLDRLTSCLRPPVCECDPFVFNSRGEGNCQTRDSNGQEWCYLERSASDCSDARPSRVFDGLFLSNIACDPKPSSRPTSKTNSITNSITNSNTNSNSITNSITNSVSNSITNSVSSSISNSGSISNSRSISNTRTCFVEDGDSVCVNTKELTHEPVVIEPIFKPIQNAVDIVTDVDKIVTKNAGIVGRLKTTTQNLIGNDRRTTNSRFRLG